MIKDQDRIHKLLERYYSGSTSTREEEEIREYFRTGDIPDEMAAEAELFRFFNREISATGNRKLEEKIIRAIDTRRSKPVNVFSRWRYYWVSGAAAVILILLVIIIEMQLRRNEPYIVEKDTYEDPYIAYLEAKKVIYFVSEKMNTGTGSLRNLEKLDAGINYVQPVFSFETGIQRLEYLNTIEKTRKLISK